MSYRRFVSIVGARACDCVCLGVFVVVAQALAVFVPTCE